MSNKAIAGDFPMSFKAGGKSPSNAASTLKKRERHTEEKKDDMNLFDQTAQHPPPACHRPSFQPSPEIQPAVVSSSKYVPAHLSVVRAGLYQKRSPLEIKNWIACLLTLDGRDKFTKVLQYTSRMLCWYFAGLAKRTASGAGGSSSIVASGGIVGAVSLLGALYTNLDVRQKYYLAISKRFEELYKALVTSRKAFRIGRSIIEWDKIASMGVGDYLNYMLLEPLADSPNTLKKTSIPPSVSTPAWKLIGTTTKLVGLMGFWAFDNASFIAGTGFLDPLVSDVDKVVLVDPKCPERTSRKNLFAEWASRFYFMGSVGGFYVNARSLWGHRRNELRKAREGLREAIADSAGIDEAKSRLKKTERDNFELCVALLKSIADITVFSNNPGVDLHLKYRGKKNHEGLHCLGGLISASTVLYNNFPNK